MRTGRTASRRTAPAGTGLPQELAFLGGQLPPQSLAAAVDRAVRHGTHPLDELVATGEMDPETYARALAAHLGAPGRLESVPQHGVDPFAGHHPGEAARSGLMVSGRRAGGLEIAAAIRGRPISRLVPALLRHPELCNRVVPIPTQAFTDALLSRAGDELVAEAIDTVPHAAPDLSARDGLAFWQSAGLVCLAAAAVLAYFIAPQTALLGLLVPFSAFFLAISGLRLIAVFVALAPDRRGEPPPLPDHELPVYTVLVPLYREANVVDRLVAALMALDYPAAKLDIKLIVEADDAATIRVVRSRRLPACFDIVTVPDRLPKTKPKALNFALALARGSLVTIFDAEDRPEPDQLRRAAAAFRAGPPDLACLQARLAWYNWNDNWLTRQFAIEYASLFDVLLPSLDRLDLPIPLGGTSNHFRADVLHRIGAWDAYNVTEDADLGIRLVRAGYRCAMLGATTWEEAPNGFMPWLRQRTRWLKGWLQTYMVHMRRPLDLLRRLGPRRFLGFQAVVGGVVVSALLHPLFFAALLVHVLQGDVFLGPDHWPSTATRWLGAVNLLAGYAAGFSLGLLAVCRRPMRYLVLDVAMVPAYWLLMSIAAYRALWQCVARPFEWEKTAHGLDRTAAALPRLATGARAR